MSDDLDDLAEEIETVQQRSKLVQETREEAGYSRRLLISPREAVAALAPKLRAGKKWGSWVESDTQIAERINGLLKEREMLEQRIAELGEIQLLAAPIVGKYDDALKRVAELEAALRRVLDLRPHLKQDLEAAEEGLAIFMVKFAKSRTLGDKLAKLLDESHQGGLYMSSPHNTQTCDTCVLLGRWAEEA